MTMGDRVAVLKDGILQQCATPRDLFIRPANTFVAGFIGSPAMNMLQCTATPEGLAYGNLQLPLAPSQRSALTTDQVTIGVRPEALRIGTEGLVATIVAIEELGSDSFVYCTPNGHSDVSLVSRTDGLNMSQPGSTVHLMPDVASMHVFDTASGARLEV
jgi:multiple sugar transport system ATP-binding protein